MDPNFKLHLYLLQIYYEFTHLNLYLLRIHFKSNQI